MRHFKNDFTESEVARFWAKVETGDGCWIWQACKDDKGYGQLRLRGDNISAHRMSYILHKGTIVNGTIMHSCDVTYCCNPDHLTDGTKKLNAIDSVNKRRHVNNRKTECVRGHAYSGSNFEVRPDTSRRCLICLKQDNDKASLLKSLFHHSNFIFAQHQSS